MGKFGFGFGASRRTNLAAEMLDLATSVTQHGVTFTFSEERPVGQYANGDWWVRGPVSITSISPAGSTHDGTDGNGVSYTNRAIHGAMVNPGNRIFATDGLTANNKGNNAQGWDSLNPGIGGLSAYDAGRNVDPGSSGAPLNVTTGSVVKFVSSLSGIPANNRPVGADMVVLTVVGSVPIADAIRPGVSRADKSSPARALQFDLSVFQNLPPTPNAPSFATALGWVDRYVEASQPDFLNNTGLKGANNHREYGRDAGNDLHRALLCLHLANFTEDQKRTLLSHMAAITDDFVARAEEGGMTPGIGGGSSLKKSVVAVCAAALGPNTPAGWNAYLSAENNDVWAEDSQIFAVSANDVIVQRHTADGRPRSDFENYMIGATEWREQATNNGAFGGSNWDLFYRDIVVYQLIGGALAVQMTTGGEALWENPDFWRFQDTVFLRRNDPSITAGNGLTLFTREMLEAYRPAKAAAPAIVATSFIGDTVWINFDLMLDELDTPPAVSDFTVDVNGSPVSVSAVNLYRNNVGLTLATPAAQGDTVTVDYAAGANPLVSVDQVAVANFVGQAATYFTASGDLGPSLFDTTNTIQQNPTSHSDILGANSFRAVNNGSGSGTLRIPVSQGMTAGTYRIRGVVSAYDGAQPFGGSIRLRITNQFSGVADKLGAGVLDETVTITGSNFMGFDTGAAGNGFRIDDFHVEAVIPEQ